MTPYINSLSGTFGWLTYINNDMSTKPCRLLYNYHLFHNELPTYCIYDNMHSKKQNIPIVVYCDQKDMSSASDRWSQKIWH